MATETKPTQNGPLPSGKIRARLSSVDLEGQMENGWGAQEKEEVHDRLEKVSGAFKTILQNLGEDADREGLQKTPMRAAKALFFFTKGYEENIECKHVEACTVRM